MTTVRKGTKGKGRELTKKQEVSLTVTLNKLADLVDKLAHQVDAMNEAWIVAQAALVPKKAKPRNQKPAQEFTDCNGQPILQIEDDPTNNLFEFNPAGQLQPIE